MYPESHQSQAVPALGPLTRKLQPGQRVSEPAPGAGHRPCREYRDEEIGAGLSKKMGKEIGVGTQF